MQQTHTTSDLLRLLAAEGRPFNEVAAAVAQRFGSNQESQAWLARTLITLLRDGLLYSEAEKMNAAFLLRLVASDVPGAREALLHLSLPESGEPAGVQAWAASLAAASSEPPLLLPGQLKQHPPAPSATAALGHHPSAQQMLDDAAAPLDRQLQFYGLPLGSPSQHLSWQGASAVAAVAMPGLSSLHQLAASDEWPNSFPSNVHSSPHAWLQAAFQAQQQPSPQQPRSPKQQQQVQQWLRGKEQHEQTQQHQEAQWQKEQRQQAQQHQEAQWQEEQRQQARRETNVRDMLIMLHQAARSPLVPALQQQVIMSLRGPLAGAITAPLSDAVGGSGGGGGGMQPEHKWTLQPEDMRGLTEHNSSVAAEVLLALTVHHPEASAVYAAAVAELPMTAQSMECLSTVVSRSELPDWVLTTFLSNCMQDTNASQNTGRQSRQVKLLCACVALVLQRQPAALVESLPELLSFCIQQSRHKQASELYRQLRDMEQAVG